MKFHRSARGSISARRFRRAGVLLSLLAIALACSSWAQAQSDQPTDFQVKAAYLYNFGKFVRWPESVSAEPVFRLCVLGTDPFDGALEQVTEGQKISGRAVEVKRITSTGGISGCRVLYMHGVEAGTWRSAVTVARKTSVLTVSDVPDFLQHGGMIQFVLVADRVRFQVNLDAARDAGLQLSAELLKVATKVLAQNSGGPQ